MTSLACFLIFDVTVSLIFCLFSFYPYSPAVVYRLRVASWAYSSVGIIITISSAKSRWLIICPGILQPPSELLRELDKKFSKYRAKSIGLRLLSCLTPLFISNHSTHRWFILHAKVCYTHGSIWNNLLLKPYHLSTFHKTFSVNEVECFLKSMNVQNWGLLNSTWLSKIWRKADIWSAVEHHQASLWLRKDFLCSFFHLVENHSTESLARNGLIYMPL